MKKHLTSLIALALFAAITNYTSDASAYRYRSTCNGVSSKWSSIPPRIRANVNSFPSGEWRDALVESVRRWNTNPSKFYFNLTYDDSDVDLNNGESEIWFSNDDSVLYGYPAVTYTRWTGNCDATISETDIIFDNRVPYTTSTSKSSLWGYGGSFRPFQTISLHELGHALGLDHVDTIYNIMGQDWTHIHTNAGVARAYPGEDASNGAVFLYGLDSTTRNDVSVVHWKRSGSSGEYSTHTRTEMYNSSGSLLNSFNDAGETRYYVNREQQVQIELTYENNGSATQNDVKIGFYISTNDSITTSDTLIAEDTITLVRNTPDTTKTTVTIPSSLATGSYYIGVIVDRTDAISERYENNNSSYIAIQVN